MPVPPNHELSDRELEILRLVATGASNKEIAQQLVISANTVKVHLRNIFAKIGATSRTEAALYAVRAGLVQSIPAQSAPGAPAGAGEIASGQEAIQSFASITVPAGVSPRARLAFPGFLTGLVILALLVGLGWVVVRQWPFLWVGVAQATPTTPQRGRDLAGMPTPRHGFAAAVYEDRILAIGGESLQGVTGVVEVFDPDLNVWTSGTPKPVPVSEVGAAVVGGLVYVPGGRTASGEVVATLEAYDPRLDRWELRAPMPEALSAYAILAYEGRLFVFGGWNGKTYVNAVYAYDPGQDAWETHPPMPTARGLAGVAYANGKIFVFGGRNDAGPLAVNEVFVPDREQLGSGVWTQAAPMPAGRYAMGAASIADFVYIVGGMGGDQEIPTSLEYLPKTNTWQEFAGPFSQPRSNLGMVSAGVYLYILGGKNSETILDQTYQYQAIYTLNIPVIR